MEQLDQRPNTRGEFLANASKFPVHQKETDHRLMVPPCQRKGCRHSWHGCSLSYSGNLKSKRSWYLSFLRFSLCLLSYRYKEFYMDGSIHKKVISQVASGRETGWLEENGEDNLFFIVYLFVLLKAIACDYIPIQVKNSPYRFTKYENHHLVTQLFYI